jgi:hypothetical protein
VTEIGEKEKMKNKLLAMLVVLTLLCGMFATAIQFSGTVKAGRMYHLDVYTDPAAAGIPINGTQDYPEGTYVEVQALNQYIVDGARYVFRNWTVDGGYAGTTNPYDWVLMNADHNITAHYKTQYKLTVETEYGTPNIWCIDCGGSGDWYIGVTEHWCDANTNAYAGVTGLWDGPPAGMYVPGCPNQWAYLVNWTEDASGYNVGGAPPYYYSDPINMNGPKLAVALWAYMYRLYVLSGSPPPLPDPPASSNGWYYEGTNVPLTAPDPHPTWINPGFARWRFDHWELDGVPQLPPNVTLIVHMDKNHTATLFYTRQSWVIRADNIGNASYFADTGKWYDDCLNYTFGPIPLHIDLGGGRRYEFRYWELDGTFFGTGMTTIKLHVNSTWDGKTLKARYQTQYRVGVETNPPGVAVIPGGPWPAWYDAGSLQGPLIAPDPVPISGESRWKFDKWHRSDSWETTNPNTSTFTMLAPYNYTAYYHLEYLAQWAASPVGLTFAPPWPPGSAWVRNGTNISWWAPQFDTTTYVFYQWKVDSTLYDIGKNDLSPWFVTGPINGIAYYVNKTKLFMDPSYHNETAHAYCHTFDVTIWASNFDAQRLVGGQPMDIYGFDMIIDFPANLIEVQSVTTNLADFFAPNDYFPKPNGQITINNQFGFVEVIATVKYNYTGFTGTKWIFKLTFHVKYDPCYPNTEHGDIKFSYVKLVNHLDHVITPEITPNGKCVYNITTVKPMLEIRNAVTHTNLVKVDKNDPQTFFDVEVYLHNGVKVKDFLVKVDFCKFQIQAVSVAIATYLKPPYTNYSWTIDNFHGYVYVGVTQDPSVPLQNCSGVLFTVRFKVVCAIWYKILGPYSLDSDITISYGRLSVICTCGPYDQTTTGLLGSISCHYKYNPLPGDLDYDGHVTVLDLQLILDHYHWHWPWGYDITGDWWTDIEDLVFVALRFGNHV